MKTFKIEKLTKHNEDYIKTMKELERKKAIEAVAVSQEYKGDPLMEAEYKAYMKDLLENDEAYKIMRNNLAEEAAKEFLHYADKRGECLKYSSNEAEFQTILEDLSWKMLLYYGIKFNEKEKALLIPNKFNAFKAVNGMQIGILMCVMNNRDKQNEERYIRYLEDVLMATNINGFKYSIVEMVLFYTYMVHIFEYIKAEVDEREAKKLINRINNGLNKLFK